MSRSYGISLGVSPREPLSRTSELARAIDGSGFDALWYIDFQLGMKDVYAAMNLAALSTERVLIGAGVTNLVTRHPTVTANATAALDELSEGRAVLGLGAGWSAVLGAGGRPSKLGDLRAGIDGFRRLFTGEECEISGTRVRLATATRQIPIYLAASQPAMLRLAGETCDGVVLMGAADPEFCSWQLDFIHEGLAAAGRDRRDLTIDLFVTMSVGDDEEAAIGDIRAWATSQAATFHPWKRMPPAWERFRPRVRTGRRCLPPRRSPVAAGPAPPDRVGRLRPVGGAGGRSGHLRRPAPAAVAARHRPHHVRAPVGRAAAAPGATCPAP